MNGKLRRQRVELPNQRDREAACELMNVSRETFELLELYEHLLLKWQSIKNLVARSTLDSIWTRHFADSAQIATLRRDACKWVEIGSGAGFPGMVIAIMRRDMAGTEVHLIESDNRKCAFLREVARLTGAPATIHHARAEDIVHDLPPMDVVTARAVMALEELLCICEPILEKGAEGLFLKGQDVAEELTSSPIFSRFELKFLPSKTDPSAQIVRVNRIHDQQS